jgi:hypothetical protein
MPDINYVVFLHELLTMVLSISDTHRLAVRQEQESCPVGVLEDRPCRLAMSCYPLGSDAFVTPPATRGLVICIQTLIVPAMLSIQHLDADSLGG